MNFEERALNFNCGDDCLYGVVSIPSQPISRGVLILVGGPQYRVGSHRQFTLLARHLAAHGVPAMRFDYRGMGDSEGELRNFEAIDDDLRSAINQFFLQVPGMTELVIWGLCDAASAALFYAHQDDRVTGVVLLNPWVRTEEGRAKAYVKHYYLNRLLEKEFWLKILRGRFNARAAVRSFYHLLQSAYLGQKHTDSGHADAVSTVAIPDRMLSGLRKFKGKILLILSGKDMTAKEFLDLVNTSPEWQTQLKIKNMNRIDLQDANHTFAQRDWRDQVANATTHWVKSW